MHHSHNTAKGFSKEGQFFLFKLMFFILSLPVLLLSLSTLCFSASSLFPFSSASLFPFFASPLPCFFAFSLFFILCFPASPHSFSKFVKHESNP